MTAIRSRQIDVRSAMAAEIPTRTYVTHGLDRYPAKMVPHLARYAILQATTPGQLLLDPFCGCGTVQVEARILGRRSIGVDVNPVAVCLSRAKTAVYDPDTLTEHCSRVVNRASLAVPNSSQAPEWLRYWFTPVTLQQLLALRTSLLELQNSMGRRYYDVLRASLAISVRKCSKADPRSPKPFISRRARRLRVGRHYNPNAVFASTVAAFCVASMELWQRMAPGVKDSVTMLGDARRLTTKWLRGRVDAVVTSPPYLTAQDYFRSSKLELAVLGLWSWQSQMALSAGIIGSGRGTVITSYPNSWHHWSASLRHLHDVDARAAAVVVTYLGDMRKVLAGLNCVLKKGGQCCLVVGDSTVMGIRLPVHRWFIDLASESGLSLIAHEVDRIRDRRLPPQRMGHDTFIDQEHLLFFRHRTS